MRVQIWASTQSACWITPAILASTAAAKSIWALTSNKDFARIEQELVQQQQLPRTQPSGDFFCAALVATGAFEKGI